MQQNQSEKRRKQKELIPRMQVRIPISSLLRTTKKRKKKKARKKTKVSIRVSAQRHKAEEGVAEGCYGSLICPWEGDPAPYRE